MSIILSKKKNYELFIIILIEIHNIIFIIIVYYNYYYILLFYFKPNIILFQDFPQFVSLVGSKFNFNRLIRSFKVSISRL